MSVWDSRDQSEVCQVTMADAASIAMAISSTKAPSVNPFLFELDKKKKPALAHEIGAGSPCLKCVEACPGLDLHYWRKICKSCKCRKEDHALPLHDEDPGNLRIGRLFDRPARTAEDEALFTITNDVVEPPLTANEESVAVRKLRFEWIPPNITCNLVQKYMSMLPPADRPISSTEGAVRRRQALERQLPLHDHDAAACHELSTEETKTMHSFITFVKRDVVGQGVVKEPPANESPMLSEDAAGKENRNHSTTDAVVTNGVGNFDSIASGTRWTCDRCKKTMFSGEVAVFAERAGPKLCWHPACFVCCECGELLADLIYFFKDDKIYCGRHFGNSIFPRCAGCDELIFAKEYTMAEGCSWHLKHFCCFGCDKELGGHRYMWKQEQPYCLECYERLFARTCYACKEKIAADTNRISHKDEFHWHARSECFYCHGCKTSLVQKRFILKAGRTFCSAQCKSNVMD